MSRRKERQQLEAARPHREGTIQRLIETAPADPLERLAYWSDIADTAYDQATEAAIAAHRAGHSYGVLGMAYGERTQGAAHGRFARHIADANG